MKKYLGCIPLIATAHVKIEARSKEEAMEKLEQLYDEGKVDLLGFDNDSINTWWVEELE